VNTVPGKASFRKSFLFLFSLENVESAKQNNLFKSYFCGQPTDIKYKNFCPDLASLLLLGTELIVLGTYPFHLINGMGACMQ
jgi:hypothetical protein